MTDQAKIETDFWDALDSDRTVMLSRDGQGAASPRPMTAIVEEKPGPIWFFTARDSELLDGMRDGDAALFTFVDKGHTVFATVSGALTEADDRAVIDRLWNPFIAAWYDGKDDPKLVLLRFDPKEAEIWDSGNSLVAGLKILLSSDPAESMSGRVAHARY
ncbi:general stress protein [Thioclava sp. BHET1]|nr:general stress protein [Thioclava sp. BHET1]